MAGTKAGAAKAAAKNIANNPNFYKEIGALGGKNGNRGGFGNGEEGRALARIAGAKGGAISRRGKSIAKTVETPKRSLWQSIKSLLGQTSNG